MDRCLGRFQRMKVFVLTLLLASFPAFSTSTNLPLGGKLELPAGWIGNDTSQLGAGQWLIVTHKDFPQLVGHVHGGAVGTSAACRSDKDTTRHGCLESFSENGRVYYRLVLSYSPAPSVFQNYVIQFVVPEQHSAQLAPHIHKLSKLVRISR